MPAPPGPRDTLIIDAVRTPVGRHGGALAGVRPDDLLAVAIKALVERTGVPVDQIEDVVTGCTNQAGEDNRNVARMSSLLAGLPIETAGQTVNRLCGSGLQAIVSAGHAVHAGEGDVFITGGVESMSRAPYVMLKPEKGFARGRPQLEDSVLGWRFVNPQMPRRWTISLGETAEVVAARYAISREEQDRLAFESQDRAAAAIRAGRPRPRRAQRSVRRSGARLHPRARPRLAEDEREWWRHRARSSVGLYGSPVDDHARPRNAPARCSLWALHDVHRCRPGHRHHRPVRRIAARLQAPGPPRPLPPATR